MVHVSIKSPQEVLPTWCQILVPVADTSIELFCKTTLGVNLQHWFTVSIYISDLDLGRHIISNNICAVTSRTCPGTQTPLQTIKTSQSLSSYVAYDSAALPLVHYMQI